jgi:hypothetical protein
VSTRFAVALISSWLRTHPAVAKNLMAGFLFAAGLVLLAGQRAAPALAQVENPVERSATVTATVPDHTPPTTPILIAPANNSLLTTTRPTFVWSQSTDDTAMSHYTLTLGGSVLFNHIPLTSTSNSYFTLTYNSVTGYYSLQPASGLPNGTHTWKITAYDAAGNSNDSVTWSFTIDNRPPAFVITDIGNQEVSISAQDSDTFPENPIGLTENEPLLQGTGEANSTVQVTVRTPDDEETDTFKIGSDGKWKLQLGILPRGVIIYLDFVIIDPAGNISVLADVPILIVSETIPLPPGYPTPPPISPGIPASPYPTPPIEIPILSPAEWQHKILKRALPFLPATLRETAKIELIRKPPAESIWYGGLGPVGALVLLAVPAALQIIVRAGSFGLELTPAAFGQVLTALGYLPGRRRLGFVFDSSDQNGIGFAKVYFTGQTAAGRRIQRACMADWDGFFAPPALPAGKYQVSVVAPGYLFPTRLNKPEFLPDRNFFRGREIVIDDSSDKTAPLHLFIPVDQDLASEKSRSGLTTTAILGLLRQGRTGSLLIFVLALGVTLIFPTPLNILAVISYPTSLGVHLINKGRRHYGMAADRTGKPIERAIFRFLEPETNKTILTSQSTANGLFPLPPRHTTLTAEVVHLNHSTGQPNNVFTIDSSNPTRTIVTLR